MEPVLPRGLSKSALDSALVAFGKVVGDEWVFATENDQLTYTDPYAFGSGEKFAPSAAIAPANKEEVQAIVRLANEHRVPLWPVSRGKNLGYGTASPAIAGSIVVDMTRMNRIIDVDPKQAYAVIEPGVGFFDLFNYLEENDIPLWMSVPGNSWGSIIGNALERGLGYTSYGNHYEQLCGLEVIMPDGGMMRTGLGAMAGNRAAHCYKFGFGPSWDQLFFQSNFGIVTQAGVWLQPEPQMSAKTRIRLPQFEDIGWAIDKLAELRRLNVIEHNFVFGNYLHDAAVLTRREDWYQGKGALPDEVAQKIIDKYDCGWWSFGLNTTGHEGKVRAHMDAIAAALGPGIEHEIEWETWEKGQPLASSARGVPSVLALHIVNWHGGRGGHMGFSPVMPPDGALALAQAREMKGRFDEFGLDYYTSFSMGQRHINNINLILYDRDDENMVSRARGLFDALIKDSKANGYAEYRTHIEYMQQIADTFDYNDSALARLNNQIKQALDPNGIIAPGKSGIGSNFSYGRTA